MEKRTIDLMTLWIVAFSVIFISSAFAYGRAETGFGAIAGVGLIGGSWATVRYFAFVVLELSDREKSVLMGLLALKSLLVISLTVLLASIFDPTGLVIGAGSLLFGVIFGALHAHFAFGDEDFIVDAERAEKG